MNRNYKEDFMREAVEVAIKGMTNNEGGPFGCIVVKDGKIVGRGNNKVTSTKDPTAHAEMIVLRKGAEVFKNWRLQGTALYVTAEPCAMCAGAIIQARVPFVVYGCSEPRFGCEHLLQDERTNHRPEIVSGVLADQCQNLLQQFFTSLREGDKVPIPSLRGEPLASRGNLDEAISQFDS